MSNALKTVLKVPKEVILREESKEEHKRERKKRKTKP